MYPIRLLARSPYDDFELQAEIAEEGIDSVMERFRKQIAAAPEDPWPRIVCASLLLYKNEIERAREELTAMVDDRRAGGVAHLLLAQIAEGLGERDQALAHLNGGLRCDPQSAELLGMKAQILADEGKLAEAAGVVESVPAEKRDPYLWAVLSDIRMFAGKVTEAAEFAAKGLARAEDLGWALETHGIFVAALRARHSAAELQRGNAKEALLSARLARCAYPLDATLGLLEAQALLALSLGDEALAIIDDVLVKLPDLPQALVLRESILHQLGRVDEATKATEYRHALENRPNKGMFAYLDIGAGGYLGTPDLARTRVSVERGSMRGWRRRGPFGLPDYAPEEQTALRIVGHVGSVSRITFSFPIVGFLRTLREAFTGGSQKTPAAHRIFDALLSLYPVAAALAVFFGWGDAPRFTKSMPLGVTVLLLGCALIRPARVLVLPLRRALGAAVLGVIVGVLAGWLGEEPLRMSWLSWVGLVCAWLIGRAVAAAPRFYRTSLRPGELIFSASKESDTFRPSEQGVTGVRVSSFVTDAEVDLREMELAELPVVIEISAYGCELRFRIQPHWTLAKWQNELYGIGTADFKNPIMTPQEGRPPHLLFRGSLIFCNLILSY
jgi:tetratricopeptide (TPR) repeat protein